MRVAVISDPHANRHALDAVLAAIDDERPDAVWCLGDLVGYGPLPNETTASVQARADICLCGNHDLAVLGTIDLAEFQCDAAAAARWTREVLDEAARTFLSSLKPSARAEGAELFHASPRDPVWEYVLTFEAATDAFESTSAPVVLVGHSHVALAVSEGENGGAAPDGKEIDLAAGRWLLNPGSVGQPRDGDWRAAFLMIDLGAGRASFRRVEYPVARTQAEMHARGLPRALAARLADGV
jgi:diadenosine tetraphosphatase ApaH/serine/threonine PP2A family protein phosphatase